MKISENITKKHMTSIVISLIIILLVIVNIVRINHREEDSKYIGEKGVLDLKAWDIDKEEILDLDGEWEFYSGKLIDPNENFDKETKQIVEVPGNWKTYLRDQGIDNGSGTYRLTIKVPQDKIYAIKARTIRFANRIYFNGEKISQVGNPSLNKDDFQTVSRYSLGAGKAIDNKIELVIHVTSLNYRSGGILKSLQIGSFDSMLKANNKNLALDTIIVAVFLTMGLYFLIIYFQRRKNIYLIYFTAFNFLTALYFSTMNEQLLSLIYDYKPIGRTEIQGALIILTSISFLMFVHNFFKELSNKTIIRIISGYLILVLLSSVLVKLANKPIDFIFIQKISSIGLLINYIYIFYILIKAICRKIDLSEYTLIVAVSISLYWIILFIKIFLEIDLGNTPIFLMVITMFSISALMSQQLHLDYIRASNLSERLARNNKLKDEFLIKSSHEFKRPLKSILNLTKNLLEGENGFLNTNQQKNIFQIQQESEVLNRITDDLMDASSIKNNKTKLRTAYIDSYYIVEEILKEIQVLIPYSKDIILKNNIENDFPLIKGDSDKFRQIIYDLIHNAIKYTHQGQVIISASILDEKAAFQIKDTGVGIKEKDIKEIFDIFFQANIEGTSQEGLGLGLSIVKDLVQIQGGEIKVESKYKEGSTFIFTLPLAEEKKLEKAYENENILNKSFEILENTIHSIKENKTENQNKEKILIIDNAKIDQRPLDNIIEELDYRVIKANSGKEALEIIKREKIDLIVLDVILSDMNSMELSSQVRKEYSMGELPILILTSSTRTNDLMKAFNYGVNDFQKKPLDYEELKSRIQSLLLIKSSAEEGIEKEFQYFYSQISPHFLYNTLNSIIGLSYNDTEKTRQALNNLSVYLRGKLDIHRKKGFVTLESELELVIAYLEIEELRYGERLKVIYDIDGVLEGEIPPLTLQPIVENAIHHGVSAISNGTIEVKTQKEDYDLISITIKDNGKGMTEKEQEELLKGNGQGIGFKNVMERIKLLKGASLKLTSVLGQGTQVKIIIPEVKNNEDNYN